MFPSLGQINEAFHASVAKIHPGDDYTQEKREAAREDRIFARLRRGVSPYDPSILDFEKVVASFKDNLSHSYIDEDLKKQMLEVVESGEYLGYKGYKSFYGCYHVNLPNDECFVNLTNMVVAQKRQDFDTEMEMLDCLLYSYEDDHPFAGSHVVYPNKPWRPSTDELASRYEQLQAYEKSTRRAKALNTIKQVQEQEVQSREAEFLS